MTVTISESGPRISTRSLKRCQPGLDISAIGKKWTYLIMRNIGVLGINRFNQILRSLGGLTPRVLIMRLNELQERGLIKPIIIQQRPRLVRWELTEKGRDTLPILDGYHHYVTKWHPDANVKNHHARAPSAPTLPELIDQYTQEIAS